MRPLRLYIRGMESSGAKITLDQESFRALASDVRVGILKRLDVRRETVTDLSSLLSLSKPTLLEHLEKLQSAGLVKRIDEGRKWIYYELSDKGRKILHPERVAITLALASAIFLAIIGVAYLLYTTSGLMAGPAVNAPNAGRDFPAAQAARMADWTGVLFLVLSVVAVGIALALRFYGQRRRDQFFMKLGTT
jgi:DNA-binding transcriptional ArsR family regulator